MRYKNVRDALLNPVPVSVEGLDHADLVYHAVNDKIHHVEAGVYPCAEGLALKER